MKLTTTTFNNEHFEFAFWVKIITKHPCCIYYFGPFFSPQEAQLFLPGYVEDLEQEGYEEISTQIEQCQPKELTIFSPVDNQQFELLLRKSGNE